MRRYEGAARPERSSTRCIPGNGQAQRNLTKSGRFSRKPMSGPIPGAVSASRESVPPPGYGAAEEQAIAVANALPAPTSTRVPTPRRTRPPAGLALGALAVVGLLAAATVLAAAKGSPRSRPVKPVSSLGWSRSDLRPISQPAPIGDKFVLYTVDHGALRITALDARSGATAWSDAASASYISPGEPPTLAVMHGLIVYLRRVSPRSARLVGVDAASGRTAWQSQPGAFTTWPLPCADNPSVICTTGYMAAAAFGASYLRFDSRNGTLLPSPSISPGTTGRLLGEGLFDPGTRQPEELLAVKGSTMAWSRTLASIFPMPGASTDWGWNFDRIPRIGLYVGSVGSRPLVYTRSRVVEDLAGNMTAGFRVSDGSVVWRAPGTEYACWELPCPGSDPSGWADATAVLNEGPTVGLGLRNTGTAAAAPGVRSSMRVSSNAKASLYGFDPGTGRVRWRFDAGHDLGLLTGLNLPPQTALNTVVLKDPRGQLLTLNLVTGSRRTVGPGTPAWCRPVIVYKQGLAFSPYHTLEGTTYAGQPALKPCTAAGQPAPIPKRAPSFVGQLGARVGGVTAWSESTGVIARPS
jgi:outer membrane protein assembly factor BamB